MVLEKAEEDKRKEERCNIKRDKTTTLERRQRGTDAIRRGEKGKEGKIERKMFALRNPYFS